MDHIIQYQFRGNNYTAWVLLSLREDGCYLFCSPLDQEILMEFGAEIDIVTDCEKVIQKRISNSALYEIKTAILEAAKKLPSFTSFVQMQERKGSMTG